MQSKHDKNMPAIKILIAGQGDTAVHLAGKLSREEQDVVVMGTDSGILTDIDARMNLITAQGKATSVTDLRNAGATGCDLFIAVTPDENRNIISAQIAKWLGAHTTIARMDNAELLAAGAADYFRHLGVDLMVYPEYLAAKEITSSVLHPWMRNIHSLSDGKLNLFSVRISDNAPMIGISLVEFGRMRLNCHVPLIKRGSIPIIPRGTDHFERGDVVYFASLEKESSAIASLCGKEIRKANKAIIAGGGKISIILANMLREICDVTVIDPDRQQCMKVSERCPDATVVNADFRDTIIWREEGIRDNSVFAALEASSETNIVSAIMAKELGAIKTVAQIEDIRYFNEAQQLGIDTVVNKKLLTSSRIYQILLDNYLESPRCLAFEDAEVVEIKACESSYITTRAVRDLKLSADMTIAGLTRAGEAMLVTGDTRILPDDSVVVFCMRGSLKKVERLFL